ncbi:MAG: hypothetical protein KC476_10970 [Cyanobacteria bacterium HKST-UBA06]|nr:hypothetical protein [Cyanobacteria bacterium HKST-UBA04]MCA9808464.1 hypothetical protein [Cyanobacteria bacterium HKST-UBA06]MCA9841365.1 hypothetical protein [Cyanobacteria bacterium HKST-UBA03]
MDHAQDHPQDRPQNRPQDFPQHRLQQGADEWQVALDQRLASVFNESAVDDTEVPDFSAGVLDQLKADRQAALPPLLDTPDHGFDEAFISAYLDGEVDDPQQVQAFEQHLHRWPEQQQQLAAMQAVRDLVKGHLLRAEEAVDIDLSQAVMTTLQEQVRGKVVPLRWPVWATAAATAAAVLAFVAVGPGHWLGGGLDLESRQLKDEVAYVISNYDTPEAYLFADDTELVARTTLQDESAESVASVVALDNMVDVMALPDQ